MERVRQVMGEKGLEIPLLLMERYGLRPGVQVVMELDKDGIRILPALPEKEDIEGLALRYVLRNLGDAATISVKRDHDYWVVFIYGRVSDKVLGQLVYSFDGKLIVDRSTPVAEIRQKALENASLE